MNLLGTLARAALYAYPREFRLQFGEAVLTDITADPSNAGLKLFELVTGGIAMRLETPFRDLTYALRRLRSAPLFVAIIVFTFALGIGVNVAVFSALNAIVLRAPFPNADRLVAISERTPGKWKSGPLILPDINSLRAQLHGTASIAGIGGSRGDGEATLLGIRKRLQGVAVTSTFLNTIGAVPEIGRLFEKADARDGEHNIIISDRIWRTYFNADTGVIGNRITIDGISYLIVGVIASDTQTPNPFPMSLDVEQPDYFTTMPDSASNAPQFGVVALLAPGTSIEQFNAELLVASARLQKLYPQTDARTVFYARPLTELLIGPVASILWMVLFAVFGILLIACANVANLIGTRWSAREREVAVRRALGASSGRIATQLFVETGVLAICGGIAGVVLAYLCLRFVPLTALAQIPRARNIPIDATTLLYALIMICLTTFLSGLVPVLSLGRADLQLVLKSAGRGGDASRGNQLRAGLMVAEVAIALALVISSGLVVRSYIALISTPLGIKADGVYETGYAHAPRFGGRHPTREAIAQANRQLLSRVKALPGIEAAALSFTYPLGGGELLTAIQLAGKEFIRSQDALPHVNYVSSDYFRALGIPLLQGRSFTKDDSATNAPVVIVNQAFADRFLRGNNPIDQQVGVYGYRPGDEIAWARVIGVVANERLKLNAPPFPTLYESLDQMPFDVVTVIVRARHSDLITMRKEIQSVFSAIVPDSQPPDVYTVSNLVAIASQTQRSAAMLLGTLAIVPLLLALSGIFGVVSFSVAQRSRELGIRSALGATAYTLLWHTVRGSLGTTLIGVAIGTATAAIAARAIAPKLTISALDPATFIIIIALVVLCAAIAATIPALRATQVDPVVALRYE